MLLELTEAWGDREEAYRIVQAQRWRRGSAGESFRDRLRGRSAKSRRRSDADAIDALFDPRAYLRNLGRDLRAGRWPTTWGRGVSERLRLLRRLDRSRSAAVRVAQRTAFGLTPEELRGRWPGGSARDLTVPEAFLFDVAWSEHCSYKSSRRFLKDAPAAARAARDPRARGGCRASSTSDRSTEERWALVVAHESHNHPSQVLPVEGAATGIGGIVRDVYCMGADVVGVLDGLRFGDLDGPNGETARADRARASCGGSGSTATRSACRTSAAISCSIRASTTTAWSTSSPSGWRRRDRIMRSRVPAEAHGGTLRARPGRQADRRSGLGGASFASQVLDEDGGANRGAVQIHDRS